MGPTRLDDAAEPLCCAGQLVTEQFERRDQVVADGRRQGQAHSSGEHVIGRLRGVHVIVGTNLATQAPRSERGDHLVGIHVRRRAGPGLIDVDRKLVIPAARSHLVGRGTDRLAHRRVDHPDMHGGRVDRGGGRLDVTEHVDHRRWNSPPRHREVLDRPLGLRAVERVEGHFDITKGVVLTTASMPWTSLRRSQPTAERPHSPGRRTTCRARLPTRRSPPRGWGASVAPGEGLEPTTF